MKCDHVDYNEKLQLFYENVAALPQRDFKWGDNDDIQMNNDKPSCTVRSVNKAKSGAQPHNEVC